MWLTERRVLHERGDEDIGLFECVPGYPAEERFGSLEDVCLVFGSSLAQKILCFQLGGGKPWVQF